MLRIFYGIALETILRSIISFILINIVNLCTSIHLSMHYAYIIYTYIYAYHTYIIYTYIYIYTYHIYITYTHTYIYTYNTYTYIHTNIYIYIYLCSSFYMSNGHLFQFLMTHITLSPDNITVTFLLSTFGQRYDHSKISI